MSITPGTWEFKPFAFTDEVQKQMEAVGIKPTRAIGNDGGVSVMTTDGDDRKLIATVASQTEFKRGKGHEVDCPERDTNARAIAEVPAMIEALNDAVRVMTHAVPAGRYATASRLNVKHKIAAILKRIEG